MPPLRYTTFIGPEGGKINPLTSINADPRSLSEQDLMQQLSVARDVDVQRGLNPDEKNAYFALQGELANRQKAQTGSDQSAIQSILGGGGGGSGGGSPTGNMANIADIDKYMQDLSNELVGNVGKQYGAQRESALRDINDVYNKRKIQSAEELAAAGIKDSGVGQGILAQGENDRYKSISDILSQLGGAEAGANVNVLSQVANNRMQNKLNLANLGLNQAQLGQSRDIELARLLQNSGQFNRTQNLAEQQFTENKRGNAIGDLRNTQALDLAAEAGRRQADSEDGGLFGNVIGAIGGIGSLASGVGGLAGGIGYLKSAMAPKPSTGNPLLSMGTNGTFGYNPSSQIRQTPSMNPNYLDMLRRNQ